MDKVVWASHILMKRPGVVVPDDIIVDVLAGSGTSTKAPASGDPTDIVSLENAPT
jgi:hypothetical protein